MIAFPYMHLPGGISRPIIAVAIEGPTARRLVDGLVDTGSDRTIFPEREAAAIGIRLGANPDASIRTAGGVSIAADRAPRICACQPARYSPKVITDSANRGRRIRQQKIRL